MMIVARKRTEDVADARYDARQDADALEPNLENMSEADQARYLELMADMWSANSAFDNKNRKRTKNRVLDAVKALDEFVSEMGDKYDFDVPSGSLSASADALLDMVGTPSELVSHFQDNPTEFMEGWRDLPAEDRSFVMQTLQTEMQMDNQITQMITNMMKAAHDTSMSVARNLKV